MISRCPASVESVMPACLWDVRFCAMPDFRGGSITGFDLAVLPIFFLRPGCAVARGGFAASCHSEIFSSVNGGMSFKFCARFSVQEVSLLVNKYNESV